MGLMNLWGNYVEVDLMVGRQVVLVEMKHVEGELMGEREMNSTERY